MLKIKNKTQIKRYIYITNNPPQVIKSKFLQKRNAEILILTDYQTKIYKRE